MLILTVLSRVGLEPTMSNVGLPDRQEPQAAEQIEQRGGLQASDAAGGPAQPPDALQSGDPRYRQSQTTALLHHHQGTRSSHIASCISFCQPVLIASGSAVVAGSQAMGQSVWSS